MSSARFSDFQKRRKWQRPSSSARARKQRREPRRGVDPSRPRPTGAGRGPKWRAVPVHHRCQGEPASQVEAAEQVAAHPVADGDHCVLGHDLPRAPGAEPLACGVSLAGGASSAPGCPAAAGSPAAPGVGDQPPDGRWRRADAGPAPRRTAGGAGGSSACPSWGAPPAAAGSRRAPPPATPASGSGAVGASPEPGPRSPTGGRRPARRGPRARPGYGAPISPSRSRRRHASSFMESCLAPSRATRS